MKCTIYTFLILFIQVGYVYCSDKSSNTHLTTGDESDNEDDNYQVTENTGDSGHEEQPLLITQEPEQETQHPQPPTQPTQPEQLTGPQYEPYQHYQPEQPPQSTYQPYQQPQPQYPQQPQPYPQPYQQHPPYGPYQHYQPLQQQPEPVTQPPQPQYQQYPGHQQLYPGPYQPTYPPQPTQPQPTQTHPYPYQPYYPPTQPQYQPYQQYYPPTQPYQPYYPGYQPYYPGPQGPQQYYGPQYQPQPVPTAQPIIPVQQYPGPQPTHRGPHPQPQPLAITIPPPSVPQQVEPEPSQAYGPYQPGQTYTKPTGEPETTLGRQKKTDIGPIKTQKGDSKKQKGVKYRYNIFWKKDKSGKLIPMDYRDYEKTHHDSAKKKYMLKSDVEQIYCDGEIVYTHVPGKPYISTLTKNTRTREFILKREDELVVVKKVDDEWQTSVIKIPQNFQCFTKDDKGNDVLITLDQLHVDLGHFHSFKYTFNGGIKCHKIMVNGYLVWEKEDEDYPMAFSITCRQNVAIFFEKITAVCKRIAGGYKFSHSIPRVRCKDK